MSDFAFVSVLPSGFAEAAMAFLSRYGYLALLLFVFAETSLLFPFLPSELVMPAAAAVLVTGSVSALAFVGVAALGTVAGSLFAYYVFGAGSSRVVDRFGSYVRVSEPEIERAQRWFGRWGESSVFWGRLLPGLRSVISIPAGFARMNVVKFLLYAGTGGSLFAAGVAALVLLGVDEDLYSVLGSLVRPLLVAALASARTQPVLAVGVCLLVLFALLLARNAYAVRSRSR